MFWTRSLKELGKIEETKISVIVTCMDRESHLLISLKSWLDLDIVDDVIVVDWCSKSKLYNNYEFKKILKNKKLTLLEVADQKYFSLSKSLNLATDFCKNEVILKVDADYIRLDESWLYDLNIRNNKLSKENQDFVIHGSWQFNKELSGLCLFNKSNFSFYREELKGWGWEDLDMYKRMSEKNESLIEIIFFNVERYVSHIPHPNKIRTENYQEKNLAKSNRKNIDFCYGDNDLMRQRYNVVLEKDNYKKINYISEFYKV